ncbi:MAG: fimbrillin family protein, partial [Alistipes sp.]|nr:fimbrillin family protein [Alistipes sp.]
MKRFVNLLSALALIVSMQGCGSSPSVEPDVPDNPIQSAVQLRLKGHIASIAPSTRVNESGFVANDKVGVYVSATDALSSSGNMLNNEAFTYSSGNITAPAGKEVYWGTEDTRLSVWAYYPYAENVSNNAAYPFVVHANQVGANNFYNSDFITAKATNLAPQTTPVNLTFNHSLSKINVTLTAGEGITNDELAAAEKNMYIKGMIVDGTIDLSNGMASVGTTKADIMPFATDSRTYSAIVYPQQGTVTFRLEMDDDVFTYTTDVDYVAAKQYDYTLTVNVSEPQQMTLNATTINPWGDGEDFSGTMSDIINIPDPIFKEYLLCEVVYEECEYDADSYVYKEGDITLGSSYTNTYYRPTAQKIDTNNDGEISITEAKQVNVICLRQYNDIANLTGIEYFVNLEILDCDKPGSISIHPDGSITKQYHTTVLSSLDMTKNEKLKVLSCNG